MRESRILNAEIKNNSEIAQGVFKLTLLLPANYPCPAPGQFVCVYLNDESRLLPRPLSVCDFDDLELTLVYAVVGAGTRMISGYRNGTLIRVSTPMGNGFVRSGYKNCILVGGGLGVPPLLYLSNHLSRSTQTRVLLGFKSEPFLLNEFRCPVNVATDDGSVGYRGNVVDLLKKAGVAGDECIFACGPKPMLRALSDFAEEHGISLWVSLEERMGCGFGACFGCVCKTKGGNRKVCDDGPVFNASEVSWE